MKKKKSFLKQKERKAKNRNKWENIFEWHKSFFICLNHPAFFIAEREVLHFSLIVCSFLLHFSVFVEVLHLTLIVCSNVFVAFFSFCSVFLFASELHINIEGSNERNFSAKNIKKREKKITFQANGLLFSNGYLHTSCSLISFKNSLKENLWEIYFVKSFPAQNFC